MGAEEELAVLRARVAALVAERDELLYAASHDLAAPLRTLNGFLGLLDRRLTPKLEAGDRELLAFAIDGANQLKVLMEGVLRLSRAGTRVLEAEELDVAEVLEEARAACAAALGAVVVGADGALGSVAADRELLRRALCELLSNAGEAGAAHVRVSRPGGEAIVVEDDGPGVPADQHAKVLALLGRLQPWSERPRAGAGLAVVRRVAERHGGTVLLSEAVGGGLRVALFIPNAHPEAP